eukprot:364577-Chlamydomonas_euryale.AAC.24
MPVFVQLPDHAGCAQSTWRGECDVLAATGPRRPSPLSTLDCLCMSTPFVQGEVDTKYTPQTFAAAAAAPDGLPEGVAAPVRRPSDAAKALYRSFKRLFSMLPLAALISGRTLVLHGGLFRHPCASRRVRQRVTWSGSRLPRKRIPWAMPWRFPMQFWAIHWAKKERRSRLTAPQCGHSGGA